MKFTAAAHHARQRIFSRKMVGEMMPLLVLFFCALFGTQDRVVLSAGRSCSESAVPLAFSEFFLPSAQELVASPKLLSLAGKRARIIGFMAQMEEPPHGAFYLVPRPVYCDESGGGTADLPPEAVRVIVRSAAHSPIAYTPRRVEVTGVLEIVYKIEPDGQSSMIRLILDRAQDCAERTK